MADTYGYGPDGKPQYGPGSYDQWGVFMGNRAPLRPQSNVSTPGGFDAWTSDLPFEQWLPEYAKIQLARGRGSLGPEVTAQQGTPEYRDQVGKRQEAAQWIIDRGGTVGDMGIRPAKGAGLNLWNKYADVKGGTYGDRFRQMAMNMYNRRAEMAARRNGGAAPTDTGGGGGFGGSTGGGSFTAGQPAPALGTTSASVPTRGVGVNPGFASPGGPQIDPSMLQSLGGRRGLRGLIG